MMYGSHIMLKRKAVGKKILLAAKKPLFFKKTNMKYIKILVRKMD